MKGMMIAFGNKSRGSVEKMERKLFARPKN